MRRKVRWKIGRTSSGDQPIHSPELLKLRLSVSSAEKQLIPAVLSSRLPDPTIPISTNQVFVWEEVHYL